MLKEPVTPTRSRWPKKGDQPFRRATNDLAAPLVEERVLREVLMIDGFMQAGAALADKAMVERFRENDLVYPAIYCYRHAIELWLKWLLSLYGPAVGVKVDDLDHDLRSLWGQFRNVCLACGTRPDDDVMTAVEQIVKQFHDWDKLGDMFRYATRKNGGVKKFQYSKIDLRNLKDVMAGVDNLLNGCDGWLTDIALA